MKYVCVTILSTICFGCTYSIETKNTPGSVFDVAKEIDSAIPRNHMEKLCP
jgi:hypothetical protein